MRNLNLKGLSGSGKKGSRIPGLLKEKKKKMKRELKTRKKELCHLFLYELPHSFFSKNRGDRYYYYPHLTGKETAR